MNLINIILGARKNVVSEADALFTNKEPHLFIGKHDKTMSLLDNGESFLIAALPELVRSNEYTGKLVIPTSLGNFLIQWGVAVIAANSTVNVTFPTTFERECFGIFVSQKDNDAVSGLMGKPNDRLSASITIAGGANNETIQWVAFGY